jgi:hypothetical protein
MVDGLANVPNRERAIRILEFGQEVRDRARGIVKAIERPRELAPPIFVSTSGDDLADRGARLPYCVISPISFGVPVDFVETRPVPAGRFSFGRASSAICGAHQAASPPHNRWRNRRLLATHWLPIFSAGTRRFSKR